MWRFLESPGVDLLLLIIAYLALRTLRHRLGARQDRHSRAPSSADRRAGPALAWGRLRPLFGRRARITGPAQGESSPGIH
jgi:hypothetical protein